MRTLEFGEKLIEPDVRKLGDLREVIFDQEWLKTVENPESIELYHMYRGLAMNEQDRNSMQENALRYDITVIQPLNLGMEYPKTLGHYHPPIPGSELSYTEVYKVLEGEAHYLLQKSSSSGIEDIVLVEAEVGDKLIIPPNYGHITINPSSSELMMANWVSDKFSSIYGEIKEKKGATYYELTTGEIIRNENYEDVPELRRIKAKEVPQLKTSKGEMYYLIRENPSALEFLNNPGKYMEMMQELIE